MLVYRITNTINGKVYIGKTMKSLAARWTEHLKSVRAGSDFYFHKAVRKYSSEAFKTDILYEASTVEALNAMETFFIVLHQSHKPENGYNLTLGGDGVSGLTHTERTKEMLRSLWTTERRQELQERNRSVEQRRKVSQSKLGRTRSEKECKSISDGHRGQIPWNKGMTLSDSQKVNMFGHTPPNKGRKMPELRELAILRNLCLMGAAAIKGSRWMNHPSEGNRRVVQPDVAGRLRDGWVSGRSTHAS
jgi:group I intron endonuclease